MTDFKTLPYPAAQLRRYDRERYLITLFAPHELREDLFALFAFNHELAKTSEVVSEALLGEIRLQWWRDALSQIYEGKPPRKHEVVEPLAQAIQKRGLAQEALLGLVDARTEDLAGRFERAGQGPENLSSLEGYLERTSGRLLSLAFELAGTERQSAVSLSRSLGIAYGLVGLLRALPFHLRSKRLYLPEDHLSVAGVDRRALFELQGQAALSGVVMRLAKRAAEHLEEAAKHAPKNRAEPALMLKGCLVRHHLKRLEAVDYDPFNPKLAAQSPSLSWKLWWADFTRRPMG